MKRMLSMAAQRCRISWVVSRPASPHIVAAGLYAQNTVPPARIVIVVAHGTASVVAGMVADAHSFQVMRATQSQDTRRSYAASRQGSGLIRGRPGFLCVPGLESEPCTVGAKRLHRWDMQGDCGSHFPRDSNLVVLAPWICSVSVIAFGLLPWPAMLHST